jgi:hypothetical protein
MPTEQNLGLRNDDKKPAFDASVDHTGARNRFRNSQAGLRPRLPDRGQVMHRRDGTMLAKVYGHFDRNEGT